MTLDGAQCCLSCCQRLSQRRLNDAAAMTGRERERESEKMGWVWVCHRCFVAATLALSAINKFQVKCALVCAKCCTTEHSSRCWSESRLQVEAGEQSARQKGGWSQVGSCKVSSNSDSKAGSWRWKIVSLYRCVLLWPLTFLGGNKCIPYCRAEPCLHLPLSLTLSHSMCVCVCKAIILCCILCGVACAMLHEKVA